MNRLLGYLQVPEKYLPSWFAKMFRATDNELSRLTAFAGEVEWNPGSIASSGTSMASGTVTSVSVTTANGVSGSVANPTTTPAITLTLGAITPSSVAASGTVTGSNLSGTNTGDQTITLTGNVTGSGTGSFAATIANDAVTYAKMQNISAASRVLGRGSAGGSGDPEELTLAGSLAMSSGVIQDYQWLSFLISDLTTALTTGTAKFTFRLPACTVSAVRASLQDSSSSGNPTFDINESGTTILSTKLSIDSGEKTSTTAATAAVISDATIADDAEMTIDIDTAGTGAKGAIIYMKVTWT